MQNFIMEDHSGKMNLKGTDLRKLSEVAKKNLESINEMVKSAPKRKTIIISDNERPCV